MPKKVWSERKLCIAHMNVFGCVAYAMVPGELRGKLNAKCTKCLLLGNFEGTKAYRLTCLQI